jgi:ubiquinone/menaquinone biosynthesis C-methylase UbiE
MKYPQFDYYPGECSTGRFGVIDYWSRHWELRVNQRRDLRSEPIWTTMQDILCDRGIVLEAGCGSAQWVVLFDSLGHSCIGVDFSVQSLIHAHKRNSSLRLLACDLRSMPFQNAFFDYIFCNGAVEHDVGGPETALREFCRVLKPSGRLMCSVPCLNVERLIFLWWIALRDWLKKRKLIRRLAGKTDPFEFYQYLFTPKEYRTRLESSGFQVLALRPYGFRKKSRLQQGLSIVAGKKLEFYNPHMMMAICRK